MQVTMSNQKSTESAIKNLEVQVGQLAKQIAEKSSSIFGANTKKNPKEECKVVMTRSMRPVLAENEGEVTVKEPVVVEDVIEEEDDEKQKRDTPITVSERKIKSDREKENEKEKEKEKREK